MRLLKLVFLSTILMFSKQPAWANQQDPLEEYLNTLSSIDPEKTSNPKGFRASREIAVQFAECLRNKNVDRETTGRLACATIMEAKILKLSEDMRAISEADFVQAINKRAFQNLATTYSWVSQTYKDRDDKTSSDLCEGLKRDRKLRFNCPKDQQNQSYNLDHSIAEEYKRKPSNLESLALDYNLQVKNLLSEKSYLANCENNKRALEKARKATDAMKELDGINIELAQLVRSENISTLRINRHPLALLLKGDGALESEVITNFDPFSNPFREKREQIKFEIRVNAAELLGAGEQLKKAKDILTPISTADEIKQLDFYIKNYPVATGQMLALHPDMISKICEKLAAKKGGMRISGNTWGDSIIGAQAMTGGFATGIISPNPTAEKNVIDFLNETPLSCKSIDDYYEKIKRKAEGREVMINEDDFVTAFKILSQKIPAGDLNAYSAKTGLKLDPKCPGQHFAAFEVDMKNQTIKLLKKINDDPEFTKLLNDYAARSERSQNPLVKRRSPKISLLMAYLARHPESKSTPKTITQSEVIERIRSQLKDGSFNIDKLIGKGGNFCIAGPR